MKDDKHVALCEPEIERIRLAYEIGQHTDKEIEDVFRTTIILRKLLRAMFNRYHAEPVRRQSYAEPINNSELAYLKELAAMEDGREGLMG